MTWLIEEYKRSATLTIDYYAAGAEIDTDAPGLRKSHGMRKLRPLNC